MVDKFMGRDLVDGSLIYGKGTRRWELNLWEGSLKMGTKYVRRALRDGSLIYWKGARKCELNMWERS